MSFYHYFSLMNQTSFEKVFKVLIRRYHMKKKEVPVNTYIKKYKQVYKPLMILPLFLFLISFVFIFQTIGEDGTPINRDVSLKGGLSAIIDVSSSLSSEELKVRLEEKFPSNSFVISELYEKGVKSGFIVDTDVLEDDFILAIGEIFGIDFEFGENYNSNFISPTLGSAFFKQAVTILLISFVLMSLVIFLYFREIVPSFAVVLSALFDIIVTVGILDLMDFSVSVAGVGALLMIIGYSIDTDVLLTNRLIKEKGDDYFEKAFSAFKTGTLMSLTTLVAGIAALILTNSEVIFEIALILVIGLLVDYISTWVQNLGLLMWWLEKRDGR